MAPGEQRWYYSRGMSPCKAGFVYFYFIGNQIPHQNLSLTIRAPRPDDKKHYLMVLLGSTKY